MRYDFSDDPYYQTAKQEKAEMEERERLEDEAWQTEVEEMDAACKDLGRKLEDIVIHDDRDWTAYAPPSMRFTATWGDPDLDCLTGAGATPQSARWNLIDQTDSM